MFKIYISIYNIIIHLIQPYIWIRFLFRKKRIRSYHQNWLEHYSIYLNKKIKSSEIILHAVSLGEILSTQPLIHELQKYYPNYIITLTSMTPAGLHIAHQLKLKYRHIQCVYLPYDLPYTMKHFINKIKPKLVIIMETELWPNLINILYQNKIPLIVANARLSLNSFIKYKKIKYFFHYIIQRITIVAAQHKNDANRFLKLGLKKNQLHIIGNLKFDITIDQNLQKKIALFKKTWNKKRFIWIASSTHSGEEILLLQAHKILLQQFPNLLMILAPRHPERFPDIIKITQKLELSHIIYSNNSISIDNVQVIINNTIGNLMVLYGVSDIAFIGGSLIHHGGHNPLEPAVYSIPLIMGPYTFNFENICKKLHQTHGLIYITNTKSLVHVISMLLKNQTQRQYHGYCANQIFKYNQGSVQKLMHIINDNLSYH